MYLALGFGIAAPAFVLAGESVRRAITWMLAGPTDPATGPADAPEFART